MCGFLREFAGFHVTPPILPCSTSRPHGSSSATSVLDPRAGRKSSRGEVARGRQNPVPALEDSGAARQSACALATLIRSRVSRLECSASGTTFERRMNGRATNGRLAGNPGLGKYRRVSRTPVGATRAGCRQSAVPAKKPAFTRRRAGRPERPSLGLGMVIDI